jgi:TonB family protein
MKTCFLLFAVTLSVCCFGQQKSKDRQYLDKNRLPQPTADGAVFYRTVETVGPEKFVVRDYHITEEPLMVAECSQVTPSLIKNGKYVSYHKNGNIADEMTYEKNLPTGPAKFWYEDGKLQSDVVYTEKGRMFRQHFDKQGNAALQNGNGIVVEYFSSNANYSEVKDSLVVSSYMIDQESADTIYSVLTKMPEYNGGFESLIRDLKANVEYPKSARRQNIQGTVYVQFIIDKAGKVTKPKVLRGIQTECDQIAMDAVSKLKPWSPGVSSANKPAMVRYVLPVAFKLR